MSVVFGFLVFGAIALFVIVWMVGSIIRSTMSEERPELKISVYEMSPFVIGKMSKKELQKLRLKLDDAIEEVEWIIETKEH